MTKDARPREGGGATLTPSTGAERPAESSSLALTGAIQEALALVADEATPFEDRAALYTGLYRLQLTINRVIRKVQSALVYRMTQDRISQAGALSVKRVAAKVEWTANLPHAWTDPEIQGALLELSAHPLDRVFVRHVPDHYEVDTQALAAAMVGELRDRTPAGYDTETVQERARYLYRTMKESRWRRELESYNRIEVGE